MSPQWWILVRYYRGDGVPRAIGPYPSHEMCRLAGHALMPSQRRFWTEAQCAEEDARAAREAEEQRQKIAAFMAEHPGGGTLQIAPYSHVTLDKEGQEVMWTSTGIGWSSDAETPTPVTGCVQIDADTGEHLEAAGSSRP